MLKKCCRSSFFCCFSGNNTQSSSPPVVTTLPDSGPSGNPSSSTSTDKIIKDTQSSSSAQPPANNSANNNASPAVVTTPLPASSSQDNASSSSSAKCGLSSSVPTHNDSGASGNPSSSTAMVSELTEKIIKNKDITLDGLIDDISKIFKNKDITLDGLIKTKSSDKKPSSSSRFLFKPKDILSEVASGISDLKDLFKPAKSAVQDLLTGIGQLHSVVAVLLVVGITMEKFETLSANQEECLFVLEQMSILAQNVKKLKERPALEKNMETSIKRATEMIVKGAFMCCTQMSASGISKFFSSTVNKEDLVKFQQRLQTTNADMLLEMGICNFDANQSNNVRQPVKGRERPYPEHADAGLERPVGMSPFQCRVEGIGSGDGALESHLEHMAARIPGLSTNEIPLELQGYIVGVTQRMRRVLQRITYTVLCYHEHHPVEDISD